MRRIGTLADGSLARRFCDYLMTLSIDATSDADGDEPAASWNIWIREEQDVEKARGELAEFEKSPEDPRYQVGEDAARIRNDRIAQQQQRVKQHRETVRSMPPDSGGFGPMLSAPVKQQGIPITIAIIVISVIASFGSGFSHPRGPLIEGKETLEQQIYFGLSCVDRREWVQKNEDDYASIREGQVWRFVTPMFLHGGPFHLLFNMLWIFYFGSVIERLHGSLFFLLLTMSAQFAGMMLQVSLPVTDALPEALHGSPFAVGASGAVYGLFGYLWVRPAVDPSYPIRLQPTQIVLMLGWLVACMTPLVPNVANGGHLGGLFAGMLAAMVTQLMRR
jgi:GlpG protein